MTLQDSTHKGGVAKKRPPAWRKVFLEALRNTGNVTLAADTAGVHRNTAYDAKDG